MVSAVFKSAKNRHADYYSKEDIGELSMNGNNIKCMSALKLQYPVYTLDKQLLLSPGAELTPDTLDYVSSLNQSETYRSFSLMDFIRKDLLNVLKRPPYNVVFSDQNRLAEIIKLIEKVSIVLPVLQILDYFKKHDIHTYRHILSTYALTTLLARDLIHDYKDMIMEIGACPAHDIGKICVPLHVLQKSDALTAKELNILRHHTIAGYVLLCYYLRDSGNLSAVIARDHHERKNGSGYPSGKLLKSQMVEIVAASDVYDALISYRPYRTSSYDNRTALEVITVMAERGEIGWDVAKALVSYNRKNRPEFSDCIISDQKRGTPPKGNVYGIISDNNGKE